MSFAQVAEARIAASRISKVAEDKTFSESTVREEGEDFSFTYGYLSRQSWSHFLLLTLVGLLLGVLIYYFFRWLTGKTHPAYFAVSLLVGCLCIWFFSGMKFEVQLSVFLTGICLLTILLTIIIFAVYDFLNGYGSNSPS